MTPRDSTEWYERWFDEDYLALYSHRDSKEAQRFVDNLWANLELRPGMAVADVPCGAGRHSLAFAERGARVVGVDLSMIMLGRAEEAAEPLKTKPLFVRGDLRRIPVNAGFHVAANIFTSIGYFKEESENRTAFAELARILLPGGILVLDVINPAYLKEHFVAETSRETPDGHVFELREFDEVSNRVTKHIRIQHGRIEREIHESIRLYNQDQLTRSAEDSNLIPVEFWGNYDGGSFTSNSPRLILFAKKAI
jgi:ubiquinone/menaquinone biosynthesis C-methylase UbiE